MAELWYLVSKEGISKNREAKEEKMIVGGHFQSYTPKHSNHKLRSGKLHMFSACHHIVRSVQYVKESNRTDCKIQSIWLRPNSVGTSGYTRMHQTRNTVPRQGQRCHHGLHVGLWLSDGEASWWGRQWKHPTLKSQYTTRSTELARPSISEE